MASYNKIIELFDANPFILRLLVQSDHLTEARSRLYEYLNQCEQVIYDSSCPLHPLEKKNTLDCIKVFKNIISTVNEEKTNHSCLKTIWTLATEHWRQKDWPDISNAFCQEMQHLFRGVIGLSGIYSKSGICKREVPPFMNLSGREAAVVRSQLLNDKTALYEHYIKLNSYTSGLNSQVTEQRKENKNRILKELNADEENWNYYEWHLKNIFTDVESINKIISLTNDEENSIRRALQHSIPFAITPFYLSLLDHESSSADRSLREHVIPNRLFLEKMCSLPPGGETTLDYMNETDTSPVDLVTRRYPQIAIFKPFNSCSQICVYCQRNWELTNLHNRGNPTISDKMDPAFAWFRNNPGVKEVLITGGDPLVLDNKNIKLLLDSFSNMPHIRRIRIGTRTLVTAPMRFDADLLSILASYHNPPHLTITIVTHIQNAYELSLEMVSAVNKIKNLGIDILNQQVFTIQNCRKFETCFLRENLRAIGIFPYYLFNLKGKEETDYFRVPIARLLQENKEEARLMPGTLRTDRPVFNVPTLGKNDLWAWQDHEVVMILNDGGRVYEFFPWEKYMAPVNTFLYTDVPINDFLERLVELGENTDDYKTIWYYF